MSQVQTGVLAHDTTVRVSEGVLQAAVAAGGSQAAINAAHITHYRNCLASAITNNCGTETFRTALKSLGVQS